MIFTIALIVKILFKMGQVKFSLQKCELEKTGAKIATRFETTGVTKWGSTVQISGDDCFWFKENTAKIIRHQSAWDQVPKQVFEDFLGKS